MYSPVDPPRSTLSAPMATPFPHCNDRSLPKTAAEEGVGGQGWVRAALGGLGSGAAWLFGLLAVSAMVCFRSIAET